MSGVFAEQAGGLAAGAAAVRAAALRMRDQYPNTPMLWAAHIHVGR